MMEVICSCCGRTFIRSPRHPNQSYCSRKECQNKRRARWQKQKMVADEHYRLNQKTSQRKWLSDNPGYWKRYRQSKPEQAERNRWMQIIRNRRMRNPSLIAKMDASETRRLKPYGQYYIVPAVAKMDALKVSLFEISGCYT